MKAEPPMNTDSNECSQGVGPAGTQAKVVLTEFDSVTELAIGCAIELSNRLGVGFNEKVYERGMVHPMRKAGLDVQKQVPLKVTFDGVCLGEYFADLIVNGCILIELKAIEALAPVHTAQCINYLRATGLHVCLLINFGKPRLQWKRIVN
jgi:GxxExxY protein